MIYDHKHNYGDEYPIDILNIDTHQFLIVKNTYDAGIFLKLNLHL